MDLENLCPHCMESSQGMVCPKCGKNKSEYPEMLHALKPFTKLQDKYIVGTVIGAGGFGITYIGMDINLEIKVAIKEFYPNGFVTREANITSSVTIYGDNNRDVIDKWKESFLAEARRLAKCSNMSGVVGVKDFFKENNTVYIVQEYLDGCTLKEYVKNHGGKVSEEWLMPMMEPIILALQQVHEQGIIHRDISPDNIMVLNNNTLKILDFGAARTFGNDDEKSMSVLLKRGYAPEEQYRTKGNQGPWSDVYALCATMYKCLTGVTPIESMERLRNDKLTKMSELGAEIQPWRERVIIQGMAVFAEDRFQSMQALHTALYENNQGVGISKTENNKSINQDSTKNTKIIKKSESAGNGIGRYKIFIISGVVVFVLLTVILTSVFIGLGNKNEVATKNEIENFDFETLNQEDDVDGNFESVKKIFKKEVEDEKTNDNFITEELQEKIDTLLSEGDTLLADNQHYAAMSKYMEILDEYSQVNDGNEDISKAIQEVYTKYKKATINYVDMLNNMEIRPEVYTEMRNNLKQNSDYAEQFKNAGVLLDSAEIDNYYESLYSTYRDRYIARFNEFTDTSRYPTWSEEEAWNIIRDAESVGLFDINDKDDPLTLRYCFAKAYYEVVQNKKALSNGSMEAYNNLYNILEETDYSLLIMSYLAKKDPKGIGFHYTTLVNMLKDYQGIQIGKDIKIDYFWYFNDFGKYSVDSRNGVQPQYREAIRQYCEKNF